ncbi:hypothetical protein Cp1R7AA1_053 [Mesorhizobium phage Cp1R7A-A1]|nr:hypothetical protein Cp1R7AA1_053 [Mesorhizobium phage Cp1R7A-A1]
MQMRAKIGEWLFGFIVFGGPILLFGIWVMIEHPN